MVSDQFHQNRECGAQSSFICQQSEGGLVRDTDWLEEKNNNNKCGEFIHKYTEVFDFSQLNLLTLHITNDVTMKHIE